MATTDWQAYQTKPTAAFAAQIDKTNFENIAAATGADAVEMTVVWDAQRKKQTRFIFTFMGLQVPVDENSYLVQDGVQGWLGVLEPAFNDTYELEEVTD